MEVNAADVCDPSCERCELLCSLGLSYRHTVFSHASATSYSTSTIHVIHVPWLHIRGSVAHLRSFSSPPFITTYFAAWLSTSLAALTAHLYGTLSLSITVEIVIMHRMILSFKQAFQSSSTPTTRQMIRSRIRDVGIMSLENCKA